MITKNQEKLRRAERMALQKMEEHGYRDPRMTQSIKGTVHDFDKIKEYDQKMAYFIYICLADLEKEVTVNVPRQTNDWVNSTYG